MKNRMRDDLSPAQESLVACYERLVATLREHRGRLEPFEERNAIKAVSALWQVMNGLDMDPAPIDDIGC